MTDALLREASDPATTGERLEEIFLGEGWMMLSEAEEAPLLAALANPSFPILSLASFLLLEEGDPIEAYEHHLMIRAQQAAWQNASVPLLLLSQPRDSYLSAAEMLLDQMSQELDPPLHAQVAPTLEARIAAWAAMPPPQHQPARAFARHLAGLFGLPWPEDKTTAPRQP